jgi:hypothetical protein
VHGVLTWDEARILQGAKVAASLGLPGGDPEVVMRCRDKHLTRQALATAGVPQPRSILGTTVDEALAAAEQIGDPVVLKPRALAASLGVVRVDTPTELATQFAFAHDTTVPGAWQYDVVVLVEEYATGPEISTMPCTMGRLLGCVCKEIALYWRRSATLLTPPINCWTTRRSCRSSRNPRRIGIHGRVHTEM